jgi:hypothetical protein
MNEKMNPFRLFITSTLVITSMSFIFVKWPAIDDHIDVHFQLQPASIESSMLM